MTTKTAAKKSARKTSTKTAKLAAPADKSKSAAKPAPAAAPAAPQAKPEAAAPASKSKPAAKRDVIRGDAQITVVAKENPRRVGTLGAKTFALYKTGLTVAEWRELCRARDADAGYLHADIRAGFISVK